MMNTLGRNSEYYQKGIWPGKMSYEFRRALVALLAVTPQGASVTIKTESCDPSIGNCVEKFDPSWCSGDPFSEYCSMRKLGTVAVCMDEYACSSLDSAIEKLEEMNPGYIVMVCAGIPWMKTIMFLTFVSVSYTHLTLPTILRV